MDRIIALRDWLLKNEVGIADPIFCEAVAHTKGYPELPA